MCDGLGQTDPFGELSAAVARFIARTRHVVLTKEELEQALVREQHVIDSLRVDFACRLEPALTSWDWEQEADGTSPIGWLTNVCHMNPTEAGAAVCVSENMRDLERTVGRLDTGAIGFAHLVVMARTNDAVRDAGATLDEERLLAQAEKHSPHQFRRDCAHARHAADATAFHRRQQAYADERFLDIHSLGGDDGGVWIKGCLGAVGGATLRAALDPLARRLGADDDRLREQRLADALVEMAEYVLNTGGQGAPHCQVPHLQLTASVETLGGLPGAPAGELDGSVPVSAATVERLSCSASVRRILLDSESLPFDIGRARRMPSTATRIKVEERDRGCVWPRCSRTVRWTQVHHVSHWARDRGATEDENLICLCWKHHDDVHLRGWQVVRVEGQREVLAIPPIPPSDPLNRGPSFQHAA